jgi:peptidoglycan hydrolase-like protein with peptidoglycan-binding domain
MSRVLAAATFVLGLVIAPLSLVGASVLVLEAQHALKGKGFDPGALDGVYGPKTQAAVREFEKKNDLPVDGLLSLQTLSALGVTNSGAGREFDTAGTNVKRSYASGGKQIGEGGKTLGSSVRRGEVVDGAKEFGKELGHGVARIGRGTGHAATNAAKGVKDTVTGNK